MTQEQEQHQVGVGQVAQVARFSLHGVSASKNSTISSSNSRRASPTDLAIPVRHESAINPDPDPEFASGTSTSTSASAVIPHSISAVNNSASTSAKTAITNSLKTAIALCFVFFLVELIAGWWCGSLAILSDAFHLLSDVVGFAVSVYAIRLSQIASNKDYTFGFKRVEVLGASLSTLSIWVITLFLVVEAVQRLFNPNEIDAIIMFYTALFGVAVNVTLAFTLHSGGNTHGKCAHGHSHGPLHTDSIDFESFDIDDDDNEREHERDHPNTLENTQIHGYEHGHSHGHDHSHGIRSHNNHHRESVDSVVLKINSSSNDHGNVGYERASESLIQETVEEGVHDERSEYFVQQRVSVSKLKNFWLSFWAMEVVCESIDMDINARAAILHVISDLISSIGVLIASIVLRIQPTWTFVDPICTFFFSILIVGSSFGTPPSINVEKIETRLLKISNVSRIERLNVWSLGQDSTAANVLLVLSNTNGNALESDKLPNGAYVKALKDARIILEEVYGIDVVTVGISD
ncbi:hypothetical protein HK100_002829 [Physocladia obscura]|uniref:Cation efflux protein transmembrane domain-containing protein n=1 Tax=Physocladia obscura TaxID=109957 RepID=A0AAD5X9V7_9FUNG|nr:hypothetical protein HK100_002829 [Physocladia obscura]